jgi:hypothetical protein
MSSTSGNKYKIRLHKTQLITSYTVNICIMQRNSVITRGQLLQSMKMQSSYTASPEHFTYLITTNNTKYKILVRPNTVSTNTKRWVSEHPSLGCSGMSTRRGLPDGYRRFETKYRSHLLRPMSRNVANQLPTYAAGIHCNFNDSCGLLSHLTCSYVQRITADSVLFSFTQTTP